MNRSTKIAASVLAVLLLTGNNFGAIISAEEAAPAAPAASPVKSKKPKRTRKPKAAAKKDGGTAKLADVSSSPKKSSMDAWLKKMKSRITQAQTKGNKIIAVAAVRGAEVPETPPLYWKGKKGTAPVEMPELKEFDEAIDSALNSDNATAKAKLQSFMSSHPNSALIGDAEHTLTLLNDADAQP